MNSPHYIHITDSPIVLRDGEQLIGEHIIGGGSTYGRILFTSTYLVEIVGQGVRLIGNYFQRI